MMWTEQQDERLLKLWPTHSASEIGRVLGVSRGAVIGRRSRLLGRYQDYVSPSVIEKRREIAQRRIEQAKLNKQVITAAKLAISRLADRNTMICWALDKGATRRALAEAFGVTQERIRQIGVQRL